MLPFWQGAAFISTLLVAIGPQNAFVLRHGLKRQRVFAVALVSALCDALLISAGVLGFGAIVSRFPLLTAVAAWAGAAFLAWYAVRAFRSAARPGAMRLDGATDDPPGLRAAVLTTMAFSLLNPHVWLDTVVLFGGLAAQQPATTRWLFGVGGASASFVWFFAIAYGARGLSRFFERPMAWRVLDTLVGLLSLWLAVGLVLGALRGPAGVT
jgi:L-lysine exporter family protein LysE/ArgO